jgi:hypothetical protein
MILAAPEVETFSGTQDALDGGRDRRLCEGDGDRPRRPALRLGAENVAYRATACPSGCRRPASRPGTHGQRLWRLAAFKGDAALAAASRSCRHPPRQPPRHFQAPAHHPRARRGPGDWPTNGGGPGLAAAASTNTVPPFRDYTRSRRR